MKCLTLTQPYATLIATGAKTIETRSWQAPRSAIGQPLAIHAAKGMPFDEAWFAMYQIDVIREALSSAGYRCLDDLERGAVVATCRLVDCVPTAGIEQTPAVDWLSDAELAMGDLSDGRYAWLLADVRRLTDPIPARGGLGLWEVAIPETAVLA